MNTEMFAQERQMLEQMQGGRLSARTEALYRIVRSYLLLTSDSQMLLRRELALIAAFAQWTGDVPSFAHMEETELQTVDEEPELIPPNDNPPPAVWDAAASRNGNIPHEYNGKRMPWSDGGFKSKPGDPVKKWETGRPLTYISEKDGKRYPGLYRKPNPKEGRVNITSCEQKKVFSVPVKNVELSDLSPPSTAPRAVAL